MVHTASPPKASAGVSTAVAPMTARAASGERFHTVTACPALTRLAAMGLPMLPKPMKPILMSSIPVPPGPRPAPNMRA